MFQNRGLGLIGAVQQSVRPMRENFGSGVQSVRRGVRQASSGVNIMESAREIRENIQGQQAAAPGGVAPAVSGARQRFSFQTRSFVEQTAARPADPSRPVKGRIVVNTGL